MLPTLLISAIEPAAFSGRSRGIWFWLAFGSAGRAVRLSVRPSLKDRNIFSISFGWNKKD
jgi:hypothetical protein